MEGIEAPRMMRKGQGKRCDGNHAARPAEFVGSVCRVTVWARAVDNLRALLINCGDGASHLTIPENLAPDRPLYVVTASVLHKTLQMLNELFTSRRLSAASQL